MRGHIDIAGLLGSITAKSDPSKVGFIMVPPSVSAMDRYSAAAGPPAAAWLLKGQRKSLHATGSVDFKFPVGARLPPWFTIAMGCLKQRKHWSVTSIPGEREAAMRVTWKRWRKVARASVQPESTP